MFIKSYHSGIVALVGLLLLSACSEAPKHTSTASQQPTFTGVRGHLLGADGKPMAAATVQLQTLGDLSQKQPLEVDVAVDGSYSLDLQVGKQYGVTFIGLAHEQIKYVIDFNKAATLGMEVRLDYLPMFETPENVNLFIFSMAKEGSERPRFEKMILGEDGRYSTVIDVPKGKFRYKFDGVSAGMHLIGDPTKGPYQVSSYGDFLTLVDHPGGQFTVSYQHVYKSNPLSDKPLQLSGDWGAQRQALMLQRDYGRLLSEQRIAQNSDKSGEFVFDAGLVKTAKWREQYKHTQYANMVLAMSTVMIGQKNEVHSQAFERFDGKTQWLYLPEVKYSHIMKGAAVNGITGDSLADEQITKQAYMDFYIANKAKFTHYTSYFSDDEQKGMHIARLAYDFKAKGDKENYRELYTQLQQRYSHINNYGFYMKMLAPPAVQEGQAAPEFSITALNNVDINYTKDSFEGKLLLIDFWATWCAPCIKEMPDLHHAYQDYQAKGFEILSLSADINKTDVTDFTAGKWKMPWQHAYLDGGDHPVVQDYGVVGYPAAFLVNEQGVVIATGEKVRGKKLLATLKDYFANK